jgi:hypothetical protein
LRRPCKLQRSLANGFRHDFLINLDHLLDPSNRDLADELAVNFCYVNSKGARRRLVRALDALLLRCCRGLELQPSGVTTRSNQSTNDNQPTSTDQLQPTHQKVRALVDVPRGSLQLLPYWSRIAATLSQCYPEIKQGESVQALTTTRPRSHTPTPSLTKTKSNPTTSQSCLQNSSSKDTQLLIPPKPPQPHSQPPPKKVSWPPSRPSSTPSWRRARTSRCTRTRSRGCARRGALAARGGGVCQLQAFACSRGLLIWPPSTQPTT